jgi:hypothetical protein
MARTSLALAGVGAALAVLAFAASGVAFAGGGNSGNAKICQKGGWASPNLQDGTGRPLAFANQDECVSFGAENGQIFNPSLIGDPNPVGEDEDSFFIASGFHPLSLGELTVHVLPAGGTITLPAMTTETGGLPAGVGTTFPSGACTDGVTGAEITLEDAEEVHASTTVLLACP